MDILETVVNGETDRANDIPLVTYELGIHQGQSVIFIRFKYDSKLIERVKKMAGVRWNPRLEDYVALYTCE